MYARRLTNRWVENITIPFVYEPLAEQLISTIWQVYSSYVLDIGQWAVFIISKCKPAAYFVRLKLDNSTRYYGRKIFPHATLLVQSL